MSTLAKLTGSVAQVSWAITLRQTVLNRLGDAGALDKVELLSRVSDATWWIANKDNFARNTVKPPAPHQLDNYVVRPEPPATGAEYTPPAEVPKTSDQKPMRKVDYSQRMPRMAENAVGPVGQLFTHIAQALRLYDKAKEANPYLYFELARDRKTDWMCWLVDQSRAAVSGERASAEGKLVLCSGQGATANEACEPVVAVLEALLREAKYVLRRNANYNKQ
jgi:hypothetical protein